jgi:amino acid adenylation domain-containing protein
MQRPVRWLEAIHRYQGTTSGAPNFAYELCVRKIKPEECEGLSLRSWRVVVNGAEPVRADTLARFVEKFAPYGLRPESLAPAYGMAETTLVVSGVPINTAPTVRTFHSQALETNRVQPVAADDPHARKLVGCGPPAADMEVEIVDPQTCRPVAPNVVGEIWVRSASVGQGYWNRPEETQRFFRASLAGEQGGRYLRTGDLGFLLGGELYVAGRMKELIILGGRNFYPHDLERALQDAHPALKADGGAAFAVEADDQERLVIVHEMTRPRRYDFDEVIAAIRHVLAEQFDLNAHAIALIPSGSLPKTSSGKTRRRQCREDFLAGRLNVLKTWSAEGCSAAQAREIQQEAPQTPTEESLARMWRDLLGIENIGRQSDFFALGGQSLRVAQLLGRIAAEWGVEAPLRRFFDDPTLAGMAAAVDEALAARKITGEPSVGSPPVIPRTAGAGPYPLSFSQQRLWFLEQVGEAGAAAHVPVMMRLRGPMDQRALEIALNDLAARHEMLRARFMEHEGVPAQEIAAEVQIPFERHDLASLDPAEQEHRFQELKSQWMGKPFELGAAPLARAGLVTRSDEDHVFVLVLHHLICDGWSVEILLRDLHTAYEARCENHSPVWATPPVRYVDYARWRQEWWRRQQLDELAYWRRRLEGAPPSLDLPTDQPRTSDGPPRPVATVHRLPRRLSDSVEALARARGATPFMVHLAAFQTLLSRYAGREDLCVGTAVAGRMRPELENTVGCFINTVALRGDLAGNPKFEELLQRTRDAVLEDLQHADAPFEKLIEAVQPQRLPGAAPLVQAFFLYQTPGQPLHRLGDAVVELAESDYSGLAVFDVSLVLEPQGDQWQAALVYDRRLFDDATVSGMLESYLATLEQAVADPRARLAELPIPAIQERRRLAEEWNATESALPAVEGFHELFELQAEKTPDAPAVEFGDRRWSYRELNDRADHIAHVLRQVGVGANTPVGVYLARKPDLVATLLAVSKAGGAYVPLDPEYPAARLEFMIRDCAMPVLVSETGLAARLPQTEAFVVELEELFSAPAIGSRRSEETSRTADEQWACLSFKEADSPSARDRLAYIIYTSGSTGVPKGVMVPQPAVVNFLASMAREPGLTSSDAMLAVTTVSFDIAVLELFLPLAVGAKVVLADRETATDGRALAELIASRGVTAMQATPAMYRLLLASDWRPVAGMKVLVGGESLTADLASQLLDTGADLWNMYGPTETTVWSAIHHVRKAEDPMPIGRPIANTQAYVVDSHGALAPRGAVGELWIGGSGVAHGYWNRGELTNERFIEDGFSRRFYKTGDLVRWRSDGVLEFVGRADSQVKVRGFRIELGEIEAALARHPGVREAAAVAPVDASGDRRLVAYFAPTNGKPPSADELRRFLGQSLPPYMIPAAFAALSVLPRTPAGKIDRKALPSLEGASLAPSAAYVAPRSPLEQEIAAAWCDLLRLDRVGVEDNFFELGGHSLLAAQLASRLRECLQVELPLREFYHRPTIAALAEAVVRQRVQRDGLRASVWLDRLEAMSDEEAAALLDQMPDGV